MQSSDSQPTSSRPVSLGGGLKKLGLEYLRGIDALIRMIGTAVIIGILYGAVWALGILVFRMPFGVAVGDVLQPLALLLITPFVIRYGILAGGFEIPPIFGKRP